MNTPTLVLIVCAIILLTILSHILLRRRVQRISPHSRYTAFAILLGVGGSAQVAGAALALASGRVGLAWLSIVAGFCFGAACILEMRKLSREFSSAR